MRRFKTVCHLISICKSYNITVHLDNTTPTCNMVHCLRSACTFPLRENRSCCIRFFAETNHTGEDTSLGPTLTDCRWSWRSDTLVQRRTRTSMMPLLKHRQCSIVTRTIYSQRENHMLQGISPVRSKAPFVAHISFSWLLIEIITVQLVVAVHILEIDVTCYRNLEKMEVWLITTNSMRETMKTIDDNGKWRHIKSIEK